MSDRDATAAGAAEARVDVAVVGASLAGCATAIFLGRAGLTVALIDKHPGPDSYKRLCGHFIQSSATPVIERLGLAAPIEAAGGVRNGADIRTEWGLLAFPDSLGEPPHGYSLRRSKLDPLIREIAMATPGVSYMPGNRAVALLGDPAAADGGGVELRDRHGNRSLVEARLVVGADGRNSTIARLAGARERRSPNTRFCYASYYSGVGLPEGSGGRAWWFGHEIAVAAPNDEGLTVMAVFLDKRNLATFKADREGALHRAFATLPEPPVLAGAEREEPVQGYTDYDLIVRDPAPGPAVALVGDAGLTSDPAMAIGCGWALQSAEWLAESLAPALAGDQPLAPALKRYRRERRRRLMGHHRMIALNARVRRMSPAQRLLLAAGTSDPQLATTLLSFGERSIPAREVLSPSLIARAALAKLGKVARRAG